MKVTIVYDSVFGNTEKVAKAIATGFGVGFTVNLLTVQKGQGADLSDADLLIVGSPTRGFRPTPMISEFVESLSVSEGKLAAAFDTRIDTETINPAPLRWVVEAGGYAADRIAASLKHRGFQLKDAAGFLVVGTEGPLKDHELERAAAWAQGLTASST
jgi:flavodoxin